MRTSSKDSSGSEGHKHAHVMFSSHLSNTIPYKNTTSASTSASNMISDSWEAVNAKLQYEKHLQDLNDRSNNNNNSNNNDDDGATASHHDVLMDRYNQRREFYSNSSCGSSNSNSNNGSSGHHDGGPHPAVVSTSHKPPHRSKQPSFQLPTNGALRIDDIQTNFGEIVNPAPAAFSPQFTRKHYRSNDRSNVVTTSNGGDGDNESDPSIQQDTSTVSSTSSNHFSYHQNHLHHQSSVRPKTVFIPVVATITCDGDADAEDYNNNSNNNNNTADADRTHADNDVSDTINGKHNNDKSKFLNKRAVHYNEYKVLQAMRAKMKAEEEEEEELEE